MDGRYAISNAPAKDRLLWQCRTAATAMRRGSVLEAKQILDEVIPRIEGRFQGDRSARKARSYFAEESKKAFIGEPYERVMAYYYRGIIYWMDGEPDTARACATGLDLVALGAGTVGENVDLRSAPVDGRGRRGPATPPPCLSGKWISGHRH